MSDNGAQRAHDFAQNYQNQQLLTGLMGLLVSAFGFGGAMLFRGLRAVVSASSRQPR